MASTRDLPIPSTDTKQLGAVRLDYAFQIRVRYDASLVQRAPTGRRVYQRILGGEATGARIKAAVYPDSGGNYDLLRDDGVRDVFGVFMLKTADGQWIYLEQAGIRRRDGYYKVIAYVDTTLGGAHDWMNNTTFAVTAKESANGREVVYSYYEAN